MERCGEDPAVGLGLQVPVAFARKKEVAPIALSSTSIEIWRINRVTKLVMNAQRCRVATGALTFLAALRHNHITLRH